MLDITFISDYVCPYCLVAKEALEQVIIKMRMRKDTKITFLPLELTPPEKEQVDTYNDPVRREHYQVLVEPCTAMGLNMKLPPNIVPRPRTRLAYEAWLYACEHDRGNLWNSSMYHAYFVDELDIGDREVLKHIAKSLLMDPEDMERAWDEHRYTERLIAMETEVREMYHPSHVPTIYCNGQLLETKDYSREELEAQLQRIIDGEKAEAAGESCGCGPDGCGDAGECGPDGCNAGGCGPDGCC